MGPGQVPGNAWKSVDGSVSNSSEPMGRAIATLEADIYSSWPMGGDVEAAGEAGQGHEHPSGPNTELATWRVTRKKAALRQEYTGPRINFGLKENFDTTFHFCHES